MFYLLKTRYTMMVSYVLNHLHHNECLNFSLFEELNQLILKFVNDFIFLVFVIQYGNIWEKIEMNVMNMEY
jgi:hypothetical protein